MRYLRVPGSMHVRTGGPMPDKATATIPAAGSSFCKHKLINQKGAMQACKPCRNRRIRGNYLPSHGSIALTGPLWPCRSCLGSISRAYSSCCQKALRYQKWIPEREVDPRALHPLEGFETDMPVLPLAAAYTHNNPLVGSICAKSARLRQMPPRQISTRYYIVECN
jgi:hypothetical protein